MEPFSLAIRIFAGDHFSEGGSSAIAILWLFVIIVKVLLLVGCAKLAGIELHLLSLEYFLFGFFLVLIFQLVGKHLLVLSHFTIELIGDFLFLFGVSMQFPLLLQYHLIVCF